MDLRPYIKTQSQIDQGIKLIKSGEIFYQPFILADNLEIGEGQNFCDDYKNVETVFDLNVYAEGIDFGTRKLATDKEYFAKCNADYRYLYDFILSNIQNLTENKLNQLEFAEIGCNTGLNLFNLAKAGAKSCIGYDWNNLQATFSWLNDILKTHVQFKQGIWDNLHHKFSNLDVAEVDIMINTIFTNHQCDPLQFLSYICDRSRVGVFLWVLINGHENYSIEFPHEPHPLLAGGRPFPLCINNGVSFSKKLFIQSLASLGFGEVTELNPEMQNTKLKNFSTGFVMFYAKRTSEQRSAYWPKPKETKRNEPTLGEKFIYQLKHTTKKLLRKVRPTEKC